jgi:hypothetical protein
MKVGIFGDSFAADRRHLDLRTDQEYLLDIKGWPDFLRQDFEVVNHAESGSSLYYSIDLYRKFHSEYDKNIFLITYPGRFLLTERFGKFQQHDDIFINNISSTEEKVKTYHKYDSIKVPNKHEIIKILETAIDYFIYLEDSDFQKYVHDLMIDNIKNFASINNNTLIIPVQSTDNNFGLDRVLYFENEHWNLSESEYNKLNFVDKRLCHMTIKNNFIFYRKIKEWIDTGTFDVSIDDFEKPSLEDKRLYIKEYE